MSAENQAVIAGSVHAGQTTVSASPRRTSLYRRYVKRPLDVFLVLLGSPIVVPVVFILALLVWKSGGQPFYSQQRVGRDGKQYRMWKLRSMVIDADQRLATYLEENEEARLEWETTQKLRHDPRVTPIGHFIRRSSLDELPQLWNVLKGDMSLIGPRPMMPCQEDMYQCDAYYVIRPGITGYWQTAGRNNTSFADRAWFDERYERDLSFGNDLGILVRTVGVVLKATGH